MNGQILCGLLLLAIPGPLLAAGKQLTGQHAPTTTPALSPAEAQTKFVVPEGFEVRLFAAEPDVINPVAMTWDERGRLWVVELYEYPLGAKPGVKPRDCIKILEDTDNDGRADKVTVFADGLNLATGILLGNGGVYVGQAPDLLFLQDTNHDDHADTQKVLLTGFGLEDRHELLNGFTWGPDGWLYMTHGVFTRSKVKIPEATEPGIEMNAAVARFHPRTKKFEVFADGTSNPWGVDFDRYGNAFVSACVIDHLFHMAPGGIYQRQGGVPANPYAYELLPSIVEHKHYMAAYCGICIYEGDQFPAEYRGRVFMGNIHQNAINQDRLIPNGSSFKAVAEKDFVTTSDGWFRPVSEQVGPDGALWIADWCDKYPCYQNAQADPEGVDRERGRIWRVVYVGNESGRRIPSRPEEKMDLRRLSVFDWQKLLAHSNSWQRRTAQRLLTEQAPKIVEASRYTQDVKSEAGKTVGGVMGAGAQMAFSLPIHDLAEGRTWKGTNPPTVESRLAALWILQEAGFLGEQTLTALHRDKEPAIRMWVAIFTGHQGQVSNHAIDRLVKLASDADLSVRLGVAVAVRQIVSSSLTVNTDINADAPVGKILAALIKSSAAGNDPLLPFMIWQASEPVFAKNPAPGLRWLAENGAATKPLSEKLNYKAMRRLCDLGEPEKLNLAVSFLAEVSDQDDALVIAALDGLLEGQRGKPLRPTADTQSLFAKLDASTSPVVKQRAQQLGALWGEEKAMAAMFALLADTQGAIPERLKAIQAVAQLKDDTAREALLKVIAAKNPEPVVIAALRGLSGVGGDDVGAQIIGQWQNFSPDARTAAADLLVSRKRWIMSLLSAIETKAIPAGELPVTAVRTLGEIPDEFLRTRAVQVIGRIRPASQDKQKLIAEKKAMILKGGAPDLKAGHELAQKTCFICHKLHDEGAEVGPDLTGVGRSSLDSLLANVIDPNLVIGNGYENVVIETKDDRTVSGRLVENSDARVRLLMAGPKEEVIAKSDIASQHVSELSVMPEGLEQMPDADFRNLILFIMQP